MKISTKNMMFGGLLALSMALIGCDLLDDKKDAAGPKITTQPMNQTIALGDTVHFSVVATGTGTLTYAWIVDGDTINGETTATLSGPVDATYDGSEVKCVIKDSKGTTVTSTVTIHITGLTAFPAATALHLGAQAHATLGSALDLDSGKVWLSGVANANLSKVDLVYLYYNNAAHLDGAQAARDSGVKYTINLTNGYGNAVADIKMVMVTEKPASQQAAQVIYNDGTQARSSVVANGDQYIVKTTGGKYVYLTVTSVAGTTAGTADLSVSMSTL